MAAISNEACVLFKKLSAFPLFPPSNHHFLITPVSQTKVGCCSCLIISLFIFRPCSRNDPVFQFCHLSLRIDSSCKLIKYVKLLSIWNGNVFKWNYVMNLEELSIILKINVFKSINIVIALVFSPLVVQLIN